MAVCPSCGEAVPDSDDPGIPCQKCAESIDGANTPETNQQITSNDRPIRPLGITLLAGWNYGLASVCLFCGAIILFWPEHLNELSRWLGNWDFTSWDSSSVDSFSVRVWGAVLCLFGSVLSYLLARSFWMLKS